MTSKYERSFEVGDKYNKGRHKLTFQAVQWNSYDEEPENDSDTVLVDGDGCQDQDGDDRGTPDNKRFCIRVFGVTEDGNSVCCNIRNFCPYFYVKVPSSWLMHEVKALVNYLQFRTRKYKQSKTDDIGTDFSNSMVSYKLVEKKVFYGFQDNNKYKFIRFTFKSKIAMTIYQRMLSKPMNVSRISKTPTELVLFETNVDPIIRFIHIQDITPSGWISIETNTNAPPYSRCQINTSCLYKTVKPVEKVMIAPLRIASFDIECMSIDGSFPNPKRDGDQIIQIGTTFQTYGEKEPFLRHVVSLGETADVPGCVIDCYDDEGDLLVGWVNMIQTLDPDMLIGYNIYGFDFWYIWERIEKKYPERLEEFQHLGRMIEEPSIMDKKVLASNAYGHNEYKIITTTGRFQIDLFETIKREHKLNSYKLDFVSELFLGDHKEDVPPSMIFKLFEGSPEDRAVIASYCVKDTELPLRILNKLNILPNMIEMSNVTLVPIDFLVTRGQQIKVFSQIVKETRKLDYVIPLIKRSDINSEYHETDTTYVGATVLNAKSGAYYDPISCLDFASLYPTIMIANNLCYSTWVRDASLQHLDNVEYKTVRWEDNDGIHTHKFVQNRVGVLPMILKNLLSARKKAKKEMNTTDDPFKKSLLNGKQLALKVSCNSVYGFCGAANGMIPSLAIASSVTTLGRQMIEKTTEIVHAKYPGSDVKYGDTDSVMVLFQTPTLKAKPNKDDRTPEDEKKIIEEAFEVAIEAGIYTTAKLNEDVYHKGIIDLEFEKVYLPYMLYSKKRYSGLKYESLDEEPCIDIKGLQVVRRDNCALVKTICNKIINKMLIDRDIPGAIEAVHETINNLINNKVDVDNLVLSKSLKSIDYEKNTSGYKNENVPHVMVAKKMYSRDPMTAPKSADRVPYVFVRTGKRKEPQYMKAEDPKWVKDNKIPLDTEYYLKHQLQSPISDLLAIVMSDDELKDMISHHIKDAETLNNKLDRRMATGPMDKFMKKNS